MKTANGRAISEILYQKSREMSTHIIGTHIIGRYAGTGHDQSSVMVVTEYSRPSDSTMIAPL